MGSVQRTSSARAAGALNPDLTPGQSHPGGHTRTSSIGIAGRRALAWLFVRLPGGYKCASGWGEENGRCYPMGMKRQLCKMMKF